MFMAKKKSNGFISKHKIVSLFVLVFVFVLISYLPKISGGSNLDINKDVTKLPSEIRNRLEKSIPSATFRVPILMYHYVEYVKDERDSIRKSLNINPYVFENQIKTLQGAGYIFITTSQLAKIIDGKEEFPPKPIILSFDDGYLDFYENVVPIIQKYDVKAVVYVISGFLDKPNFMYSWQVKDISSSRLFEIGAHTVNHVYLKGVSKETAESEIKQSKKMLENLTGRSVLSFAYPSGAFDLQAEELVKKAGYKTAVSTVPGIMASEQNKFFLFRIRPGNRIGNDLLNYLSQDYFKPY